MYAARPPKLATPHIVFAAEPPLISTGEPSARYSCTARSVSMSSIDPLTRLCSTRNESPAWAMTSTRALPMPTTSKRTPPSVVLALARSPRAPDVDTARNATARRRPDLGGRRTMRVPLPE